MSYDSWLEGTLSLDPSPAEQTQPALREALSSLADPRGGRLVLTPLGHGLLFEGSTDWEAALQVLERAGSAVLAQSGVEASGTLRALGEDDAHLATITVRGSQVSVERHDGDDDDDEVDWLAALEDDDAAIREQAASMLGGRDAPGVASALAAVARGDEVERVRLKALESLGQLGAGAAGTMDDVVACLQDSSPFVRYWATFALGRFGAAATAALPELTRLTSDAEDGPRYGAIDAIHRIREARA